MKYFFFVALLAAALSCGPGSGARHAHSVDADPNMVHSHNHEQDHDHSGHDHSGHHHLYPHDCDDHDHNPDPGQGSHPDDPEEIIFTAAQAARAGVEVMAVSPGPFREAIRVSGTIAPARGEQVSIVAPTAGIVSFRSPLSEGSRVASGATLFTVSSGQVSGGDELALNRAAFRRAEADYERAVRLREDNIVSQAELVAAQAEYEAALTAYRSLTDGGPGGGAGVTAPVGGYLYGIAVGQGDYVETGQLLATVIRERTMELHVEVPQRYLGRLQGVTAANFSTPASGTVYNTDELGGSLVSVGKGIQPGRPFVPVVFRFGYSHGIVAGSYAQVDLLGAVRSGVVTLPLAAVTEQQGLWYVYVKTGADVYRRRQVHIGGSDGRRVEIASGLEAGEQVVVRGAVNIRMAAASGAIPHSHEH